MHIDFHAIEASMLEDSMTSHENALLHKSNLFSLDHFIIFEFNVCIMSPSVFVIFHLQVIRVKVARWSSRCPPTCHRSTLDRPPRPSQPLRSLPRPALQRCTSFWGKLPMTRLSYTIDYIPLHQCRVLL